MITASEALQQLIEGNQRFTSEQSRLKELTSEARRNMLLKEQAPFAIILGCSDSRVPAEIVFDQGVGDLFVIRVAGNIVAPSQVGSIEFAAETFGSPLVVVLGHTNCGAISDALSACEQGSVNTSHKMMSIVSRIRPTVETLYESELKNDREELLRLAVRANISASVSQVRYSSPIIEKLIQSDKLRVVGAEYSLTTGEVTYLDL